jgi:predicted nucleotidyltransferase
MKAKTMTKKEILSFLKDKKSFLTQNFGVQSIALFGSYARDEQREDSDIDIAVEIDSENKFKSFFDLKYYLEEHFKQKVDLGIESTIKPIVKEYVKKDIIHV